MKNDKRRKIQSMFPNIILIGTVMMYKPTEQVLASGINYNWLNSEYKEPTTDFNIPFLIHKEMGIPISECQKAYDVAIDYLRSQAKMKG